MSKREFAANKPTHYESYHAFLLRLWRESHGSQWRVSLKGIDDGEERGFSELDELLDCLKAIVEGTEG